jgi:hypothetical protein
MSDMNDMIRKLKINISYNNNLSPGSFTRVSRDARNYKASSRGGYSVSELREIFAEYGLPPGGSAEFFNEKIEKVIEKIEQKQYSKKTVRPTQVRKSKIDETRHDGIQLPVDYSIVSVGRRGRSIGGKRKEKLPTPQYRPIQVAEDDRHSRDAVNDLLRGVRLRTSSQSSDTSDVSTSDMEAEETSVVADETRETWKTPLIPTAPPAETSSTGTEEEIKTLAIWNPPKIPSAPPAVTTKTGQPTDRQPSPDPDMRKIKHNSGINSPRLSHKQDLAVTQMINDQLTSELVEEDQEEKYRRIIKNMNETFKNVKLNTCSVFYRIINYVLGLGKYDSYAREIHEELRTSYHFIVKQMALNKVNCINKIKTGNPISLCLDLENNNIYQFIMYVVLEKQYHMIENVTKINQPDNCSYYPIIYENFTYQPINDEFIPLKKHPIEIKCNISYQNIIEDPYVSTLDFIRSVFKNIKFASNNSDNRYLYYINKNIDDSTYINMPPYLFDIVMFYDSYRNFDGDLKKNIKLLLVISVLVVKFYSIVEGFKVDDIPDEKISGINIETFIHDF